jgi:DNA-binding NtrC family response regulator
MAELLIVDDEAVLADSYGRFLARGGHDVRQATSGESALRAYRERRPDVTLLDLRLPDMSGFDVFDKLREDDPVVIMISGHGDVPLAVRAVQLGVEDFLTKPVELQHLGLAVDRALETVRVRHLNGYLTRRRTHTGRVALGSSDRMQELAARVLLLARSDRTAVLLTGEPGTGKARIAELIHAESARSGRPFVTVHCFARDPSELESELFGADGEGVGRPRAGLIEVASTGTLLLDEVGDLPLPLQAKLLRVLEGKSFRRVGGAAEVTADVRFVATSTRDLVAEVDAARFREDLYYRLCVMPLALPPLRSRSREDIVELIARLMDELAPQLPQAPRALADDALQQLLRHRWPGNIRELRNVLERAMIVSMGMERIEARALPADLGSDARGQRAVDERSLEQVEREHIARILLAHEGNRTHAARALGISRATLIKKIQAYGLTSGRRRVQGESP